MTLTIHKWNETFESADTRKRERLKYFHCPSGCDSTGYVELVTCHGSAGLLAFGVFQALCQVAATMKKEVRGKFIRSNGSAMPIKQIALLIRVEICHLEAAIELLSSEAIGWLKWEAPKAKSADSPAEKCREGGGEMPVICHSSAGFVQGKGKGEDSKLKANAGADGSDDLEIIRRTDPLPETPPEGRPSLDEVKRYGASAPTPISPQCAIAFHDTQEMQGWVTNHGHPIADWRAALRRYASRWNEHEKAKGSAPRAAAGTANRSHPGSGYGESSDID